MHSFIFLLVLVIAAVVAGMVEFVRHQKRIYSIPIRIHINGTRGKSSVTRLIGAGLRAGGISAITKVTGTFPRLILEDGTETKIYRKSDANIIEQLSIIKFAASRKAEALVMECMALQPQYQWITENQMIHANVSVMTNVRMDHVDIMGHSLQEIAHAMGKTVPRKGHLFTSENMIPETLKSIADKQNTESHFVEAESVDREEMAGFSYIEHRDNVALALAVCSHLGIDRTTALNGMYQAIPDAGVLKCYRIRSGDKSLVFYNAFAANDPDSSLMIWNMIKQEYGFQGLRIILLNTRQDRLDRARQLAEMAGSKLLEETDFLILIGQSTLIVENMCTRHGVPSEKILNVGWTTPARVFEAVLSVTETTATVVAIGNMGGMGAATVAFFENLTKDKHD